MTKIIHVHLIFEKKDYYFGSISAIYTVLNDAQIGIKKSSLLHASLTDGGVKITRRAIIKQSHLIRCAQEWPKHFTRKKGWITPQKASIQPSSYIHVTFDRLKCFHTLFKCNICVAQCNNSICFSTHNSNSLKPFIHGHFSIIHLSHALHTKWFTPPYMSRKLHVPIQTDTAQYDPICDSLCDTLCDTNIQ